MRSFISLALALVVASLAGALPALAEMRTGVETRLYFGASIPDRAPCNANHLTEVTDALWLGFVDTAIKPRYPAGFTVVPASGYWQDETRGKLVTERSRVLVLVAAAPNEAALDAVMQQYVVAFCQDAVLRVDTPIGFEFVRARR